MKSPRLAQHLAEDALQHGAIRAREQRTDARVEPPPRAVGRRRTGHERGAQRLDACEMNVLFALHRLEMSELTREALEQLGVFEERLRRSGWLARETSQVEVAIDARVVVDKGREGRKLRPSLAAVGLAYRADGLADARRRAGEQREGRVERRELGLGRRAVLE